jgi:L-fucose mutarotase
MVPIESVSVMQPDDGSTPEVFARYRDLLGDQLPLQPVPRLDFYATCREPDLAVCVATGDDRLYANVLLTIGYIRPA